MPTYDYRCPECGHAFEVFQKISARSRAKCPQCGARGERLISGGAGLVFKGSGFYITDYKRAGDKHGDTSADAKGEAKPSSDAKAESGGTPKEKPPTKEKPPKKSTGADT